VGAIRAGGIRIKTEPAQLLRFPQSLFLEIREGKVHAQAIILDKPGIAETVEARGATVFVPRPIAGGVTQGR
jgi:hypothetical protein